MSTSSRIPPPKYNNFKPIGNKNFTSEELYQINNNEDYKENPEFDENYQETPLDEKSQNFYSGQYYRETT